MDQMLERLLGALSVLIGYGTAIAVGIAVSGEGGPLWALVLTLWTVFLILVSAMYDKWVLLTTGVTSGILSAGVAVATWYTQDYVVVWALVLPTILATAIIWTVQSTNPYQPPRL